MKVVLIRHPAPLIEPGICYGRLDIPIHPEAVGDLRRLADDPALCGIARIWTSPADRCRGLADAMAQVTGALLTIDPRLQELDFGEWEGHAWDAVAVAELDRWAASPLSFAPPGGESGAAIIARVGDFYTDLLRDGRDCAVVSHGGPLKVLAALLDRRPVNLFDAAPKLGSLQILVGRL